MLNRNSQKNLKKVSMINKDRTQLYFYQEFILRKSKKADFYLINEALPRLGCNIEFLLLNKYSYLFAFINRRRERDKTPMARHWPQKFFIKIEKITTIYLKPSEEIAGRCI